ncbi:MAG TPA: hypothetical protein VHP38_11180 [Ruminiclostridium sp.]|nr:hypothetical protein [Ruminiclostridium sp.]
MKLTQRDKKLLIALGVVIFTVVFLKFLLFPKLNNINKLKTDIETLSNTYTMNMAYKVKVQSLDSDIKILSKKLGDLRAVYPPSINSDELLVLMKNVTSEAQLEVKSITFGTADLVDGNNTDSKGKETQGQSPEKGDNTQKDEKVPDIAVSSGTENGDGSKLLNGTLSDIRNYFYLWGLKSSAKTGGDVVIPDGKGYRVSVKLEAIGTNDQIKTFFEKLSKLKNRAFCKTATIVEQSDEQGVKTKQSLKLTTEIVFYGIMDKGAGEYYLLKDGKWAPMPASGKKDIFKAYDGYSSLVKQGETQDSTVPKADENENKSEDIKPGTYDFSVVASHFGGGLAPSVSVCCENPALPEYSNAVVYGDNKGTENAEIFIEQKGSKYFCKFKTDQERYPDAQYGQTMEFVPVGEDLKLIMISSERTDDGDKAGLRLNIINNTDKQLNYFIYGEDPKAPRIQIGKTVGNVVKK